MHDSENRAAALKRLKRIEGQVRGLIGMLEKDRYCMDVLDQSLAIRRALQAVETLLIEDHSAICLETAIRSGNPEEQRHKFAEIIALVAKARV